MRDILRLYSPTEKGKASSSWKHFLSLLSSSNYYSVKDIFNCALNATEGRPGHLLYQVATRCYDLIIPLYSRFGSGRNYEEVLKDCENALSSFEKSYPRPKERCPSCRSHRGTKLFSVSGLGSTGGGAYQIAERLGYSVSSSGCTISHAFNRMCSDCSHVWQSDRTEDETVLIYARDRLAISENWNAFISLVVSHNISTASGYWQLMHLAPDEFKNLWYMFALNAEKARALGISIYSSGNQHVAYGKLLASIEISLKKLHQRYPLPTKACPRCKSYGSKLAIFGYPLLEMKDTAIGAACALGYAETVGCVGGGTDVVYCPVCERRWVDKGVDFAPILTFLKKRFPPIVKSSNEPSATGETVDSSSAVKIGVCPKCNGSVVVGEMDYRCENLISGTGKCDFRVGKNILSQPISVDDVTALLDTGKTKLLKGFKSNRTKRKFSAYLALNDKGSFGFEFDNRPT